MHEDNTLISLDEVPGRHNVTIANDCNKNEANVSYYYMRMKHICGSGCGGL